MSTEVEEVIRNCVAFQACKFRAVLRIKVELFSAPPERDGAQADKGRSCPCARLRPVLCAKRSAAAVSHGQLEVATSRGTTWTMAMS